MNNSTIKDGYRVIGPNTSDGKVHIWYFPDLGMARGFAEHIAKEVDAEYNILQFIATVRQTPLEPRPLQYITSEMKDPVTP